MLSLVMVYSSMMTDCATVSGGDVLCFMETDSGKTISTETGTVINIYLRGNYTTGYGWHIEVCNEQVLKPSPTMSGFVPEQTDLAGAGGSHHFVFHVVGTGRTELIISYFRPWEKGIKPQKTFTLHLEAKEHRDRKD